MTQVVQRPELDESDHLNSQPKASSRSVLDSTAQHRHDLDGLRAFAIALVVAYHVWVGRVSGGVDVFLLLSAYFMTGSLVRRGETGGLRIGTYWVNRFWRLVPVAALTIGGVLALTYYVLPARTWESVWAQSWASLFYWQNWELASTSVDYYARGSDTVSPLLHFWSLSVQGQVFVLWPLILLGCWGLARLTRLPLRAIVTGAFAAIFIASLTYSIWVTAANQTYAYYDTFARLWEFALGSLVAVIPLRKALPRVRAEVVGWIGVLALLVCGMVLDVSGGFPGFLALWPSIAAVAIIVAGATPDTSFGAFLGSKPMRWIGKIAYPLYLVHWPILIGVLVVTGTERVDFVTGTAIIGLSVALAVLVRYAVEKPLQLIRFRPRTAWAGAVALAFIAALVVVPLTQWRAAEEERAAAIAASPDYPGAAVLDSALVHAPVGVVPIPLASNLSDEWATLNNNWCVDEKWPAAEMYGAFCFEDSVASDGERLVIIGDSHSQQWASALEPLTRERDINLAIHVMGRCDFNADLSAEPPFPECGEWRAAMREYLEDNPPDFVAMVGTVSRINSDDNLLRPGLDETVEFLTGLGTQVIVFADNPRFDEDMFECVEDSAPDFELCDSPGNVIMRETDLLDHLDGKPGVYVADLTDAFCPDGVCRAVIGNIAVYIDNNHVTASYMRTLAPRLERALASAGLDW